MRDDVLSEGLLSSKNRLSRLVKKPSAEHLSRSHRPRAPGACSHLPTALERMIEQPLRSIGRMCPISPNGSMISRCADCICSISFRTIRRSPGAGFGSAEPAAVRHGMPGQVTRSQVVVQDLGLSVRGCDAKRNTLNDGRWVIEHQRQELIAQSLHGRNRLVTRWGCA